MYSISARVSAKHFQKPGRGECCRDKISLCTVLWLADDGEKDCVTGVNIISLGAPGGLGLCAQDHQLTPAIWWGFSHLQNNSGNVHQTPFSRYHRKELKQWIWGKACAGTGFPGSSDDKESAYNVGDLGLKAGLGRSPGEGNGNQL